MSFTKIIPDNLFQCKTCDVLKPKEHMCTFKVKRKDKYYYYQYYCKICINTNRNDYRKKKRRQRGLKSLGGRPFKKYNLIIKQTMSDAEHNNVTIPEMSRVTNISALILRNIIKGRVKKKYNHITINEITF